MKNIIAVFIIALVLGMALYYIIRSKKNGVQCIGCPYSKKCSSNSTGECPCKNK